MSDVPRRGPLGPFLALVALFVVVRAAFVASAADVFFYAEELEKGAAAKALLDGIHVNYARLPFHPYEGGGFVASHLKAIAFLVVGPSLLAHKLVALFTSTLVLAAGYALCVRHASRRAGVLFGVLFTFAPLAFQKLSLLSLGIHFEALAFVFVVLDRGLAAIRAPLPRRADLVVLGLAVGFGTYFSYQVGLAGAWVVLVALVRKRSLFAPRVLATGLSAFVVGFAPWLAMYAAVGAEMFDIHGAELLGERPSGPSALRSLVGATLDASPVELVRRLTLPCAAAVLGLVAFAGAAPRLRGLLAYLSGFAVFWTVAWVKSGFVLPDLTSFLALQRLAPLFGVATILVAVATDRALAASRPAALAARVLCGLTLVVGAWNAGLILDQGRPLDARANLRFLATTRGYDYRGYLAAVLPRGEGGLLVRARPWLGFREPARELLLADLTTAAFVRTRRGMDQVEAFARGLEPERRDDFLLGAGPALSREAGRDLAAAVERVLAEPPGRRELLGRALGRFGRDLAVTRAIVADEVAALAGRVGSEPILEGIGYRVFRRFVVLPYGGPELAAKPEAAREWLRALPPEAVPHLLVGFERALEEARLNG